MASETPAQRQPLEHYRDYLRLTAYLKAVDAGLTPDRLGLLALHADLAAELEEFFAEQDRFARWTEPLRQMLQTGTPVSTPAGATSGTPALDPTTERLFGDYELLATIGQGGM